MRPVQNVVQVFRAAAVGNDHLAAGIRRDLCRAQLGHHAARAEARTFAAGKRVNALVELFDGVYQPRRRVFVGVAVIKSVDIGKQDQKVCADGGRDICRQRVIVADDDFVRGDGVIFVDDRKRAELQKPCERVVEIPADPAR